LSFVDSKLQKTSKSVGCNLQKTLKSVGCNLQNRFIILISGN